MAAAYIGVLLVPVELLALVALSWLMPPVDERAWNTGQFIMHLLMVTAGLVVLALNATFFIKAHLAAWNNRARGEGQVKGKSTGPLRIGITAAIVVCLMVLTVIGLVWLVFGYAAAPAGVDGHGYGIVSGFDLGARR